MIECVPNFSEGRDAGVRCARLSQAIESAPGVLVLGWESDADHNRSVVTFAGPAEAVMEGAVRGAGKAAELIDLSRHQGVHPRVGAADVIPFVPLEGSTMDDCVAAAHRAGEEIWRRFGVPVYFYEARRGSRSGSGWKEFGAPGSTASAGCRRRRGASDRGRGGGRGARISDRV